MPDRITISPAGPLHAEIRPPGSKSLTNRALPCAAMARGTSFLHGALDSEDTRVMIAALRNLGLGLSADWEHATLTVTGCAGNLPVRQADLHVGNSGTTIRFLAAMLAACAGEFRLDGVERMRQRPIGDLLDALVALGADAKSEHATNCPPIRIHSNGLRGGTVRIRGAISSQFLSGLLMAAPYAQGDVRLQVDGELVSQPYVTMTLKVMSDFGAPAARLSESEFQVAGRRCYQARSYQIEPDASAASYFWAAAAIAGGTVKVLGLTQDSLQGDVGFCQCLAQMGCRVTYDTDGITVTGGPLQGIDVDMNAISDTVQTLAAVALFAAGPTTIRGVGHIRHKETDRIGDLARELRKLGAAVQETVDGLRIEPAPLRPAHIETYRDHRMAMSLALVGLRLPGVTILDPDCTAKTYPRFFLDLARVCGSGN